MDRITLKQLRYFEALARERHFGQAAETCAISQPALSVQIKDLESALGTPLFDRSARHVRLTAFGEDVATRIRDILRSVDELGELARAAQTGFAGRLRLGIIPTIAPYLLPRIVARLSRDYPDLDLNLRETVTPKLMGELREGKLDAAIVALPASEPGLREVPLLTETFVLVRPAADAHRPIPDRDALREMRLLLLEEGHCFRDQALSFCNLGPSPARELLDGSSLSTLVQMVAAGIGVTLIPDMAVDIETRSAPVSVARFAPPEPERRIGLVFRASNPLADRLMQVADAVRAATSDRVAP